MIGGSHRIVFWSVAVQSNSAVYLGRFFYISENFLQCIRILFVFGKRIISGVGITARPRVEQNPRFWLFFLWPHSSIGWLLGYSEHHIGRSPGASVYP